MVEDVQHRRQRRHLEAEAEQHHQQAQLADGRIGKDALQIVPEQRHHRGEHHGDKADAGDDHRIGLRPRQHRPQPRQQEHARLHHRRRVEIGADRRGRRHRVGQPEMERELRRLGEAADQHQTEDHRIERRGLHLRAAFQNGRQIETARRQPEQHHAPDQRKASAAGHRQRHAGTLPPFGLVLPEPDEEERRKTGQLPEHQQQQHIARQHDAQHRALKQHQAGKEPPRRLSLVKVEMGEDHHQQPDAEDQAGKHQPQRIDHQGQIKAQRRHPADAGRRHLSADHAPGKARQQRQPARARRACDARMQQSRSARAQRDQQGRNEGQRDQRVKDQARGHWWSGRLPCRNWRCDSAICAKPTLDEGFARGQAQPALLRTGKRLSRLRIP